MLIYLKKLWENPFIQAICFGVLLYIAFEIRLVLAVLFLGFVVMSGFLPLVEYFRKQKIPRFLAIVIPYLIVLLILIIVGTIVVPVLITQSQQLFTSLPALVTNITHNFSGNNSFIFQSLSSGLSSLADSASSFVVSLPGAILEISISLFTIIVVSIYLLWDKTSPNHPYIWLIPDPASGKTLAAIERSMGGWLRGQLILSVTIGVLAWLGLILLHVQFSAPLGVLTGILEVVPYVGPILSAAVAVIIALSISWQKALLVALLYFIIQQLEGNILVPQVMKHSVEIHPITIIVSILIGTELMGIVGAIVAVPLVTAIAVGLESQGYTIVSRDETSRHS